MNKQVIFGKTSNFAMNQHPRPYSLNNPDGLYFVTFSVVFWIDIFVRLRYKDLLVQSLSYCIQNKSLRVPACSLYFRQ